jgi:hypothetical protein
MFQKDSDDVYVPAICGSITFDMQYRRTVVDLSGSAYDVANCQAACEA